MGFSNLHYAYVWFMRYCIGLGIFLLCGELFVPSRVNFENIFGSVQMKLNLFNLFIKIELCTDETEFN